MLSVVLRRRAYRYGEEEISRSDTSRVIAKWSLVQGEVLTLRLTRSLTIHCGRVTGDPSITAFPMSRQSFIVRLGFDVKGAEGRSSKTLDVSLDSDNRTRAKAIPGLCRYWKSLAVK